jgi:hypothetical protein
LFFNIVVLAATLGEALKSSPDLHGEDVRPWQSSNHFNLFVHVVYKNFPPTNLNRKKGQKR